MSTPHAILHEPNKQRSIYMPSRKPIYVVDVIGAIVQQITPLILATLVANETTALGRPSMIDTINYQYGTILELIERLAADDKSKQTQDLKYPLVYLGVTSDRGGIVEQRGMTAGVYANVKLNILIAHQTQSTYTIRDRMKSVFKPVLYPIYYALLQGISQARGINEDDPDMIVHQKTDLGYLGKSAVAGNTGITLNDYVDAIEMTNTTLTILNNS